MQESLTIDSPRAAAIFEHQRSRRILLALIASERSLKELAVETGLSLSLLHYHVGRLRELGLVEIASESRRNGRPVKRYRSVARAFFVPSGLAAHPAGDALGRELRTALERDRARRVDSGTVYGVDKEGKPRMQPVRRTSSSGAFEAWVSLSLSAHDAQSLGNDVRALFARYAKLQNGDGKSILAYCAFAERT